MRIWTPLALTLAVCAISPATAAAEPIEIGGFFGPRRFADDVVLGADGQGMTSLGASVVLGPRIAKPILPWLVPELELALSPTTTEQYDVSVFWLEPRALIRLEALPNARVRPFFAIGAGMATTLSSKRKIYDSGITIDGFAALGVGWNPGRGLALRLDLRVGLLPTRGDAERPITTEGELLLGVHFPLGRRAKASATPLKLREPTEDDTDGDGWADGRDACPDRAEDHDGFEDQDGCPDIDNDIDQVLDISDKCATVPETYNGYDDDDGCPDTIPAPVDAVIGTVTGLQYREGEIAVRASAKDDLDKLAQVLVQHPTVRVILVGHTDDREAIPVPEDGPIMEGEEEPEEVVVDAEALSRELGRARAAAVRTALVERGIPRGRIVVDSAGAEESVSDNDTPRSRNRNRRVELRLYVPKRSFGR